MTERKARYQRETKETKIEVELALDGQGRYQVKTRLDMLNHLLEQWAHHGLFDLRLSVPADDKDDHHLVEDVALALGRAFLEALGERRGLRRMAHALVPMDEALALVAVDLSGRGYAGLEIPFAGERVGDIPTLLVSHFLSTLAVEGRFTLHGRLLAGSDDHHKAEALFKALGRALDEATTPDPRRAGEVPSTKGVID